MARKTALDEYLNSVMNFGGELLRVHEVQRRLRAAKLGHWLYNEQVVASYMLGAERAGNIYPPPEEPGWLCEGCGCEVWRDGGPQKCFACLEKEETDE